MKTTNELKKAIQTAMYQKGVTDLLTDAKVICIGNWVGEDGALSTFRHIDIAITKYNAVLMIVRISEYQYSESFSLHNVYNIDGYITSYKISDIEKAIADIRNCLSGKYAD